MEVRTADLNDADGLASCIVPTWLEAHRNQIPHHLWNRRQQTWTVDVSASAWKRLLSGIDSEAESRSHVVVATESEMIVGLVAGTVDGDGHGEVSALYVLPRHQRRGVGRRLLSSSLETLFDAGASSVSVVVLEANAPARQFYENLGGIEVGSTDVDEDNEVLPAVIYRWTLDE